MANISTWKISFAVAYDHILKLFGYKNRFFAKELAKLSYKLHLTYGCHRHTTF